MHALFLIFFILAIHHRQAPFQTCRKRPAHSGPAFQLCGSATRSGRGETAGYTIRLGGVGEAAPPSFREKTWQLVNRQGITRS